MATSSYRPKTSGSRAQQGFVEAGLERHASDWVDMDGLTAVVSDQPPTPLVAPRRVASPASSSEEVKALLDKLSQRWQSRQGIGAWLRATWRRHRTDRYQQLLEAEALGRWSEMVGLAGQLRSASRITSQLDFDLAVRLATLRARQGDLDGALEDLAPWRSQQTEHPGLYEARVAEVHAAAGNRTGFVRLMGKAHAASGQDAARVLAHALAQARFGELAEAEALMARVDQAHVLPPQSEAKVLWIQGLIAMRQGQDDAQSLLDQALAEFLRHADQPAEWASLAFCACDQVIALNTAGEAVRARSLLKRVMPVLRAQADRPLMALLKREKLLRRR